MLRPKDLCQGSGTKTFLDAMHSGKVHLARFVLDALDGRIINSKTESSRTPLMFAVCLQDPGMRSKFTHLLLEKGADVNSRDDHGRTALSLACELGHLDAIKLLVQFNADPEVTDTWGNSALMYAAYAGHSQVLEFLIRAFKRLGLRLDHTNQAGHSAIQVANYFGHSQCVQALNIPGKRGMSSVNPAGEAGREHRGEHRRPNRLPQQVLERFSKQFHSKSEEPLPALFQRQPRVGDSNGLRMRFRCQPQSQSPDSMDSQTLADHSDRGFTEDGQDALFTSKQIQNSKLRDMRAAKTIDFNPERYQREDNRDRGVKQEITENIPLWGKAKSFNLDLLTGRKQSYQGDVHDVSLSASKFKRASLQDEKPLIAKFERDEKPRTKTNDADKPVKALKSFLNGSNQFLEAQDSSVSAHMNENNDIVPSNRRDTQKRSSIPQSARQNKLLFHREDLEPEKIKVGTPGFTGLGTRLLRRFTAPEFIRLVRDCPSGSGHGKGKISRSETFPLSHTHQKVNNQPSVDSISGVRCEFESSSRCVTLN